MDEVPAHALIRSSGRAADSRPELSDLDVDPGEDEEIAGSGLELYDLDAFARDGVDGLARAMQPLVGGAGAVYLHVDLDVIDGDRYRVNPYAPGGGLHPTELLEAIRAVGRTLPVVAASVNCYDPSGDPEGDARRIGQDVVDTIADVTSAT